jgi:hypothetical protein
MLPSFQLLLSLFFFFFFLLLLLTRMLSAMSSMVCGACGGEVEAGD